MLKGAYLTVLAGPIVPVPVPRVVLDALQSAKVISSASPGSQSGFELNFTFASGSPLNSIFLMAGANTPLPRVIIVLTINSVPHVLMDGAMTNHSIQPGPSGGASTLTIMGKDLTQLMALIDFGGIPYPAMPIAARVALIIAKYSAFGIIPLVIPPLFFDVPIPVDRIPTHEGTDLEYLERMASQCGYVFYIDPGPVPGTNTAYFGPQIKIGVPQPALNIDMDAHTNVESLSFAFETAETTLPVVLIQNMFTRFPIPIPVPPLNPLQPPLGAISAPITNATVLRDTAKLSPPAALSKGVAEASRSLDAVKGNGSLDVLRYGRLLKSRQLVGVRGAGLAFDGLYFVEQVTTDIKAGDIKQSFSLTRNGVVSLLPAVPP